MKKETKMFLWLIIVILLGVGAYMALADKYSDDNPQTEVPDNSSETATSTDETSDSDDPAPVVTFKTCPAGRAWQCRIVTQGAAPSPDNPAPTVCGCAPTSCPAGQFLVTSAAEGKWPDGSLKGSFSCSSNLPPSSSQ